MAIIQNCYRPFTIKLLLPMHLTFQFYLLAKRQSGIPYGLMRYANPIALILMLV